MIQQIEVSSFKRRMSDVGIDLDGVNASLRSKIISPLIKWLMLSAVDDMCEKYVDETQSFAKNVLGRDVTASTFVNEMAFGHKDFRPVSVAKIVCTEDLTFGLRVIAYSDPKDFDRRMEYNEQAEEIYVPPYHLVEVLTKHINLCLAYNIAYRIFERNDGYVLVTTSKSRFFGIEINTVGELLLSKDGSAMFRKQTYQSRIL